MEHYDYVDNNLELSKWTIQVHTPHLKENITSDFILAKLDQEKDTMLIEGTTELVQQAYRALNQINKLITKSTTYKWNKTTQNWEQKNLTPEQIQTITILSTQIFNKYLIAPSMRMLFKRNVKENYLIKLVHNTKEDQPEKDLDSDIIDLYKKTKKERQQNT